MMEKLSSLSAFVIELERILLYGFIHHPVGNLIESEQIFKISNFEVRSIV